jgi:hypothetical protein
MSQEIEVNLPRGSRILENTGLWEKRFEIHSESSDRVYVIARNKKSQKWGCSCPGWRRWRKCKHLTIGCGLPDTMIHGRDHIGGNPSEDGKSKEPARAPMKQLPSPKPKALPPRKRGDR